MRAGSSRSSQAAVGTEPRAAKDVGCRSPADYGRPLASIQRGTGSGPTWATARSGCSTTPTVAGGPTPESVSALYAGRSATPSRGPGFRWVSPQHDLRHRRITTWLGDGKSAVLVKEAVGHSDLRTTMAYTHLSREHLRALVSGSEDRPQETDELQNLVS